jgi:hypothetical protein
MVPQNGQDSNAQSTDQETSTAFTRNVFIVPYFLKMDEPAMPGAQTKRTGAVFIRNVFIAPCFSKMDETAVPGAQATCLT